MKIKIRNIKKVIGIMGLGMLFTHSMVMFMTFLRAYFNGGKTLITVNSVGEANIEFILIPVSLIMGLYGIVLFVREK
jgi:hypothetical protein